MPRKSSRASAGAPRRSTRGAVAEAAEDAVVEDPPADGPAKTKAPAGKRSARKSSPPTPVSSRPSRSASRPAKKEESESEREDDVSEDEEEEYSPSKGRGRGRGRGRGAGRGRGRGAGSARGKGRGRGRGKKKETTPSDSEDEEEIMEAEPAKTASPAPTRSKRARASPRTEAAEPPPKRRSSRGASQAATAAIKQVASQSEEEEEEEEAPTSPRGKKRKAAEEEEYSPVKDKEPKKSKVVEGEVKETVAEKEKEEAAGDAPSETKESAAEPEPSKEEPAKTEAPMEEDKKEEAPEVTKEESTQETQEGKAEDEKEQNEADDKGSAKVKEPEKEKDESANAEAEKPADPEQKPAEKEPEPIPEPVSEPATTESTPEPTSQPESTPAPAPQPEPTPEPAPEQTPPPASEPTPEKPSDPQPTVQEADKAVNENTTVKDDAPTTQSNEEAMEVAPPQQQQQQQEEEDAAAEKDFVMVDKTDVPAHDSSEVQQSLPPPEPVVNNAGQPDAPSGNPGNNPPVVNNTESRSNGTSGMNNVADEPTDPTSDPLLTRKYMASKDCAAYTDVSKHFTIASYNILAPCHAVRGCRSGEEYQWTTEEKLTMEARHPRLRKELDYLAGDVLCLQEVDPAYFENVLVPELRLQGYEGKFQKRLGDMNEGEATFYRTSRFTLVESKGVGLRDLAFKELESAGLGDEIKDAVRKVITEKSSSVVLLTKLKSANSDTTLTVANIHVSWGRLKAPDIQCVEVACAIKELVTMAGGVQNPHVICGDFNSPPNSPAHQLTLEGYLNDDTMAKLQALDNVPLAEGKTSPLVNLWWKGFQHTSTSLKSIYNVITGTEPMSSCFPFDNVVRAVDYQWYSSASIIPLGVLQAVDPSLIQAGIPNGIFPSDHLSTKARFTFM